MSHTLKGRLRGYLCEECIEDLSGVIVRVYRSVGRETAEEGRVKDAALLTAAQIDEKRPLLLGEGKTGENGEFRVDFGEEGRYEGGPVEVDIFCPTVPRAGSGPNPRETEEPVQFTAATFSPGWSQGERGFTAEWSYTVSYRLWCFIRGLFDAWVICGRVLNCRTQQPLGGLTVKAFDVDWLQDDPLGSAVTAPDGHFRIDYTSAQFKRTIFTPLINLEMTGGPDVYFHVETSGGMSLLQEPSSRGRKPDRENRGPCFCVELCVDAEDEPPYDSPWFTNVGNFHILADIDSATGLANKTKLGVGGAGYAWFSHLKLRGFCPKKEAGTNQQMYYRFLVEKGGTETPVAGGMLVDVLVGSRLIQWDLDGDGTMDWVFQDTIVTGTAAPTPDLPPPPGVPAGTPWGAPPPHYVLADPATGWIEVDHRSLDGGFYGPLVCLDSNAVVPGGPAPGNGAGNPVAAPCNGEMVTLIFETTTDPANPAATVRQMQQPTLLVNNWSEVRLLNLQQFIAPGANACSKISANLNILYTVDHEFTGGWQVDMSSAASPWSEPAGLPGGTAPRGGSGNHFVSTAGWPPCSYTVTLSSVRKLTTGEHNDDWNPSSLTFCIC
jgi:hypothetical protein